MDQIMELLETAFFTGTNSVEAIVIAVIMALIAGRLVQIPVLAVIATLIDLALPVVYSLIENGNFDQIGDLLSERLDFVSGNLTEVGVMFVGYLLVIGLLFLIKTLLFRR